MNNKRLLELKKHLTEYLQDKNIQLEFGAEGDAELLLDLINHYFKNY
jgi:hypothetical protein